MVAPYSHTHSWKPGKNLILVAAILLILLTGIYGWWSAANDKQLVDDLNFLDVNGLPLAFVPNVGQSDPAVKFQAQSGASSIFLTKDGLTMVWPVAGTEGEAGENEVGSAAALSMHFLDVNPNLDVMTGNALPGTVNYLQGNNAADWYTNVATYGAVTYQQLYPGVDLHYVGQAGQLIHTFEVAPGVDPEVIHWSYDDNVSVSVDETTGDLVLSINAADDQNPITLVQSLPTAWQMMDGDRQLLKTNYSLKENGTVSLKIEDQQTELNLFIEQRILTPIAVLGSSGFETGNSIAVDSSDNIYIVGSTFTQDFPTVDPIQTWRGGGDVFVTKLSPDGSTIIFSTFLGGSDDESGTGIAVDSDNYVYITGTTSSVNFPVQNPFQATYSGLIDSFVAKLATDGTGLIYSTYLGGTVQDWAQALAIDSTGHVYITGGTASSDFPLVNPYQTQHSFHEAFVTKFSPDGTSLVFSTYLGGDEDGEGAYGIAVGQDNTIFVTGLTGSDDFPVVNPYQSSLLGTSNAFVTRFAADGASLIYSTYLGGEFETIGRGIVVDESLNAYVVGETRSTNFPTVNPLQGVNNGYEDVFITKLSSTGNTLLYSTYLGGTGYDSGTAIALDDGNQMYVVGRTSSPDFPVANPVQLDMGSYDIFVTSISSDGSSLVYSSYLGGDSWDWGFGIAVNQIGQANITGSTESSNFLTVDPLQAQMIGAWDAIVAGFTQDGSALEFSTYLGGSGYPPTDVTLTGIEGSNPFAKIWLWLAIGLILVVGAWVTRPRTRKLRSVE